MERILDSSTHRFYFALSCAIALHIVVIWAGASIARMAGGNVLWGAYCALAMMAATGVVVVLNLSKVLPR